MTEAYQDLCRREKLRSEALAETAKSVGLGCLSKSLASIATVVVSGLLSDSGKGHVSEPASDLQSLRTDYRLVQAKQQDIARAVDDAHRTILSALKDGYVYDATERAKIVEAESTGLSISVDLTEQELKDLESFPIQGLTAKEWAARMGYLLDGNVNQALAKPLTGAIDLAAVPAQLSQTASAHADSLAMMTKEAFYAGAKAAMLAIRQAFVG